VCKVLLTITVLLHLSLLTTCFAAWTLACVFDDRVQDADKFVAFLNQGTDLFIVK